MKYFKIFRFLEVCDNFTLNLCELCDTQVFKTINSEISGSFMGEEVGHLWACDSTIFRVGIPTEGK